MCGTDHIHSGIILTVQISKHRFVCFCMASSMNKIFGVKNVIVSSLTYYGTMVHPTTKTNIDSWLVYYLRCHFSITVSDLCVCVCRIWFSSDLYSSPALIIPNRHTRIGYQDKKMFVLVDNVRAKTGIYWVVVVIVICRSVTKTDAAAAVPDEPTPPHPSIHPSTLSQMIPTFSGKRNATTSY